MTNLILLLANANISSKKEFEKQCHYFHCLKPSHSDPYNSVTTGKNPDKLCYYTSQGNKLLNHFFKTSIFWFINKGPKKYFSHRIIDESFYE